MSKLRCVKSVLWLPRKDLDVNRDWKIMAGVKTRSAAFVKAKTQVGKLIAHFQRHGVGWWLNCVVFTARILWKWVKAFESKQWRYNVLQGKTIFSGMLVESGHHRSMPPGGSSLSHRWMCKKSIWIHCVMSMWIMWFSRSNVLCHITIRESFKSMCLSCAYRTIDFSCTILRLNQLLSLPIDCTKEHSENKNCDPPLSEFKDI